MKTLSTEFRRQLEQTVIEARDVAEAGARGALEEIAVHNHEPYGHMSGKKRKLRNRLRAHARQLGDHLDARSGGHTIDRLVHECAYEHWHGMLFARFLAENHLLIEPELGVAISLDECEELAKEEAIDKWTLAARFAHRMLPQVFRPDHPVFKVQLAREHQLNLEGLVEDVPAEVFTATDSLGWVYQFWQTKKKKEVNAAGNKIGADELPSVTQLFTEDYMVDFLLDNTLGAWWAGKELTKKHTKEHEGWKVEADVRKAFALPGVEWKYLRFLKGKDGKWIPAAGTFDGWPKSAVALRVLDPCMGSGHFVVAMFERLVALRLAEEKHNEMAAVAAVIRDNLFGLEIDPRCTQIAAFNLALAAWRHVGHCKLPAMNLACSGLAPNRREADWLAIASDNEKLVNGMERLYRLFQKASILGSLINPRASEDDLLAATFHELQPLLEMVLAQETQDDTAHEMAVTARGLAKAAEILAGQFTLVATNVPYLGRGKQGKELQDYCEKVHADAKADLATCFVERCLSFCTSTGTTVLVSPQNWFFLGTYKKLRQQLFSTASWNFAVKLGPAAFQNMNYWAAKTGLCALSQTMPREDSAITGLDVSETREPAIKGTLLLGSPVCIVSQLEQLKNPDARLLLSETDNLPLLEMYGSAFQGIATADYSRFGRCFWELPYCSKDWNFQQSTVDESNFYSGREHILRWENGQGSLAQSSQARIQGLDVVGKFGIAVSQMNRLPVTLFTGEFFDNNCSALIVRNETLWPAVWSYCSSEQFVADVREIDQAVKVTNASLVKVPFDVMYWRKAAANKYPLGLPKPFSSDPTQWLFKGHPVGADQPLQVAVARLLGYQWPRQTGSSFPDCPGLGPDGLDTLADDDGIVCVPAVRGERSAHERVLQILQAAWNDDWNDGIPAKLLADTDSSNLDEWLRNGFFEQHCKLFHHRPFILHIWDGRKRDGFHALVNYHKLAEGEGKGRRLLESLIYSYLGDWMIRQQDGVKRGEGGAEDRLAAAVELQKRLIAVLEGEPPFDLFVRWKTMEDQAIGWEPDINDGVRLNIRPFMAQDIPGGKKGAGVLRDRPRINWKNGRGKEPTREQNQYPWFWENGKFTGVRVNDEHLLNSEKKSARERAREIK